MKIACCLGCALAVSAAGGVKLPEGYGKKQARGAALKDEGTSRVIAYLVKNFGPNDTQQEARAKELVEGICTLCHELDRVKTRHYTKEEWAGTIRGMIEEGAPVTDEEFSLIVNYLTKHYGPEDR